MIGGLTLAIALLCVVMAGVIAAGEAAFARVSKREAARWVDQDVRGAAAVARAAADPAPLINVAVFLRVLLESLSVALVVAWLVRVVQWPMLAVAVAALVMGVLLFVLAGVSPRTVGRSFPERVAPVIIPPLSAITRFLGPIPRGLVKLTNAVTPGGVYPKGPFADDHELRNMVDMASDTQVIDADERRMVHAVFELEETLVREVMVPRTDLVTVDTGTDLRIAMEQLLECGFSRVPVIGDGRDDILGMLYFKDVAAKLFSPGARPATVDAVMRPARFVPDSLSVERMMENMQASNSHVAVLVDEYGGVAGMVTMEDLVEQIVGDIDDEHDEIVEEATQLTPGTYRVRARMGVSDVGELFDLDVDDDEVDTIGGLLAKAVGKVPEPGDHATIHGLDLKADRIDDSGHGLETVIVTRAAKPEDTTDHDSNTLMPSFAEAELTASHHHEDATSHRPPAH